MAAVAGTKGRVAWSECEPDSFQIALVRGILANDLSAKEAAAALQANARLREVGIDTNMVCNLSCSYCYLADREESKGRASLDLVGSKLNDLANCGVKLFAFIGKEPLADGRALNLLARLNENDRRSTFRTGMVTNGTFVTRRLYDLIAQKPCYLDVSLDGSKGVNDQVRGVGAYDAAIEGIKALTRSALQNSLSTTTVLWKQSLSDFGEHVASMFDLGVPTCFGSPVLNFAVSNDSESIAVEFSNVIELLKVLSDKFGHEPHSDTSRQIIIDLPYRYTWLFLRGHIDQLEELQEDKFEAIFWNVPNSSIVVKLNPFSFSYFRAARITHDGTVVENMDLAAHPSYAEVGKDIGSWDMEQWADEALRRSKVFHLGFLGDHLSGHGLYHPYERMLSRQYTSQRTYDSELMAISAA